MKKISGPTPIWAAFLANQKSRNKVCNCWSCSTSQLTWYFTNKSGRLATSKSKLVGLRENRRPSCRVPIIGISSSRPNSWKRLGAKWANSASIDCCSVYSSTSRASCNCFVSCRVVGRVAAATSPRKTKKRIQTDIMWKENARGLKVAYTLGIRISIFWKYRHIPSPHSSSRAVSILVTSESSLSWSGIALGDFSPSWTVAWNA